MSGPFSCSGTLDLVYGMSHPHLSDPGRVRVLTLNLWGLHGNWDERRAVLVEGIRGLGPDLVAFQEAITDDGYDQVADVLGPGYHVVH